MLGVLLVSVFLGARFEYVDPAAHILGAESYKTCAIGASNGVNTGLDTPIVHPSCMLKAFNISAWIERYERAQMQGVPALLRLMVSTSMDASAPSLKGAFSQPWFSFINLKIHIIDALVNGARLPKLWRPSMRLLDVGAGHGFLDAFLACKFGTHIKAYDIRNSYQCPELLASPFAINFFNGIRIPEPDQSFDGVSFISVLHHAANRTHFLLAEASRIARSYIIVVEELHLPGNAFIAQRNFRHDPQGVFRTYAEWMAIFEQVPGFQVTLRGGLKTRHSVRPSMEELAKHAGKHAAREEAQYTRIFDGLIEPRTNQFYFTLERVSPQHVQPHLRAGD